MTQKIKFKTYYHELSFYLGMLNNTNGKRSLSNWSRHFNRQEHEKADIEFAKLLKFLKRYDKTEHYVKVASKMKLDACVKGIKTNA